MLILERHVKLIATDSGDIQKKAYFHSVQCIILRDETEWVALVNISANRLVGTDPVKIFHELLNVKNTILPMEVLYGNGHARNLIASNIPLTNQADI